MSDAEKKAGTPAGPEGTIPIGKLPAGLKRLLGALPERDWGRLRSFVIDCEEVGELAQAIPLASRAMELCPPRMIARIRANEITTEEANEAYNAFHDSIHGVRQALFRILQLAGLSSNRGPTGEAVPEGKVDGKGVSHAALAGGRVAVPDRAPDPAA